MLIHIFLNSVRFVFVTVWDISLLQCEIFLWYSVRYFFVTVWDISFLQCEICLYYSVRYFVVTVWDLSLVQCEIFRCYSVRYFFFTVWDFSLLQCVAHSIHRIVWAIQSWGVRLELKRKWSVFSRINFQKWILACVKKEKEKIACRPKTIFLNEIFEKKISTQLLGALSEIS